MIDLDLYGPYAADYNLYGIYVGVHGQYYAGQSYTSYGNTYSAWAEALASLAVADLAAVQTDAASCAARED